MGADGAPVPTGGVSTKTPHMRLHMSAPGHHPPPHTATTPPPLDAVWVWLSGIGCGRRHVGRRSGVRPRETFFYPGGSTGAAPALRLRYPLRKRERVGGEAARGLIGVGLPSRSPGVVCMRRPISAAVTTIGGRLPSRSSGVVCMRWPISRPHSSP